MRFNDILNETAMSVKELTKHSYAANLMALIKAGTPLKIVASKQDRFGEIVVISKTTANAALGQILKGHNTSLPLSRASITAVNSLPINLKAKEKILVVPITAIEKSPEIKGKADGADFNIGGIGEICLGVAATARFLKLAELINVMDFINFAKQLQVTPFVGKTGKIGNSKKLTYAGPLTHANGKVDKVFCVIVAPGRDVTTFMNIVNNPTTAPETIKSVISSSVVWTNEARKISAGIDRTSKDPNVNNIEIVADGQSDNKGTKADLVMNIDDSRITLISAKAGPSQLGQASGKEFSKQVDFFKTVFGVDISSLKKTWIPDGKADNTPTLTVAWQKFAIPKVLRLTGGDSVQKEKDLVKSIATGLIRYANDQNADTGEVEPVDIVKLITEPGSPGYTLMRVDSRLEKALETVDLHGSHTERGIAVSGNVNGKMISLFRAWSYYSPAGETTRTAIAGGPLLDTLAILPPEQYQQDTELKIKPGKKSVAPATPIAAKTVAPVTDPNTVTDPTDTAVSTEQPQATLAPTDELAQVKKNAGIAV
jgi:hypothetical protein